MYGKYSTRKHHADILEKKLLPVFGECRIDRISRQQIQVAVSGWHETGFSPSSIHHYHSVLSAILKKAMEWGYIGSNPAHGVKLPKLKLIRPKVVLTPDEAQRLLAGLSALPQTIVALALLAGLRRGELFALRWQSFNESDPDRPFLNIQEGVYEGVIDTPKTEASLRVVPLSKEAIRFLRDWRKIAPKRGIEDFIFSSMDCRPKSHKQIMRDHIRPACDRLGLPKVSWMTFRRTFSTWADEEGVSAKQRGVLMGNSAEVNHRVYTQTRDEGLRQGVERVSARIVQYCSVSEA
jgi:integrase